MNITVIAVGKKMPTWVETGYREYADRMPRDYKLKLVEITAQKRTKHTDIARALEIEGDAILAAVPPHNLIIALDRLGKSFSTEKLSDKLHSWHDLGQDISLLIGGPEGLHKNCITAAQQTWSLSKLTLPHPLVRVFIAEQFYRAWSIISRHPYHR